MPVSAFNVGRHCLVTGGPLAEQSLLLFPHQRAVHPCPRFRTTFRSLSCRNTIKIASNIIDSIFWKADPLLTSTVLRFQGYLEGQSGHGPVCDPPTLNTSSLPNDSMD